MYDSLLSYFSHHDPNQAMTHFWHIKQLIIVLKHAPFLHFFDFCPYPKFRLSKFHPFSSNASSYIKSSVAHIRIAAFKNYTLPCILIACRCACLLLSYLFKLLLNFCINFTSQNIILVIIEYIPVEIMQSKIPSQLMQTFDLQERKSNIFSSQDLWLRPR